MVFLSSKLLVSYDRFFKMVMSNSEISFSSGFNTPKPSTVFFYFVTSLGFFAVSYQCSDCFYSSLNHRDRLNNSYDLL